MQKLDQVYIFAVLEIDLEVLVSDLISDLEEPLLKLRGLLNGIFGFLNCEKRLAYLILVTLPLID